MTAHATYKKLQRSRSDRIAGGVCGGLGRYFDVNPTFYRVGFAVLTLLVGGFIIVSTGIIGLYVGKIFDQVKGRPLYVVERRTSSPDAVRTLETTRDTSATSS